jgi:hypothetical protein
MAPAEVQDSEPSAPAPAPLASSATPGAAGDANGGGPEPDKTDAKGDEAPAAVSEGSADKEMDGGPAATAPSSEQPSSDRLHPSRDPESRGGEDDVRDRAHDRHRDRREDRDRHRRTDRDRRERERERDPRDRRDRRDDRRERERDRRDRRSPPRRGEGRALPLTLSAPHAQRAATLSAPPPSACQRGASLSLPAQHRP